MWIFNSFISFVGSFLFYKAFDVVEKTGDETRAFGFLLVGSSLLLMGILGFAKKLIFP